ncbi:MAG: serine/threonine protein kinase [Pirellulales bacterium]|nr:serine/threonine protein kinase [Pirellulales bacterium]
MNATTHFRLDELQAFVDESLSPQKANQILGHLDNCSQCRQQLDRLAGSPGDWAVVADALSDHFAPPKLPDRVHQPDHENETTKYRNQLAADRISLSMIQSLLNPSDDPRSAGRIGPFEVMGIVGAGGMGVVLKAREPSLDRFVAIKLLAPHLASSPSARKRFAREGRAAAAVIHDNVMAIYQVAQWNEIPYLVMPYHPDPSLQQRIDAEGSLNIEAVLTIAMQIARGLSAAHSQGLVHRDVKPANVLVSQGTDRAVITDFGLAQAADDASLTRAGALAGTPHYMSPEQARGESLDARSDLFSLGSVMFAMLTGKPPVQHELGSETIKQIASHGVPSLNDGVLGDGVLGDGGTGAPRWLIRLVNWLHETNARHRPESAGDVAILLEQCLSHYRQPRSHRLPDQLAEKQRRWPRLCGLICTTVSLVALLIFAVPHYWPDGQGTKPMTGSSDHHGARQSGHSQPPTVNEKVLVPPAPLDSPPSDELVHRWQTLDETFANIERDLRKMELELENNWSSK